MNAYERTPEVNNCYSVTRVGAKVRRLDLGDVKSSFEGAPTSPSRGSSTAVGSGGNQVKFGSPKGSPGRGARKSTGMCPPPSTAKKAVSRLKMNNLFDEREEDDSPRDAAEFPRCQLQLVCSHLSQMTTHYNEKDSKESFTTEKLKVSRTSQQLPPNV